MATSLGLSFDVHTLITQQLLDMLGKRAEILSDLSRSAIAHAISSAWLDGLSVQQTATLIRESVADLAGAPPPSSRAPT